MSDVEPGINALLKHPPFIQAHRQ